MSEHETETVSRADLTRLEARLDQIATLQEELRAAATPAEKREAREDVQEAVDHFEALGKQLGIPAATLRDAAAKAKDEDDYQRNKRHFERFLQELDEEEEAEKQAAKKKRKPAAAKKEEPSSTNGDTAEGGHAGADADKVESDDEDEKEPPADTEPVVVHWSERTLGKIL